jgi:outer membrane protein assembly factor BamD
MERETDAKKRLAALHQPIPRPTKAALAQSRAEEESRRDASTLDQLMNVLKKGPDVAQAAKVGDPTLVDPTPLSANQLGAETMRKALGSPAGEHGLSGEIVTGGAPAGNEPAPRSDAVPANSQPFARANPVADSNELKPAASDPNELKAPDPNELKPTAESQSAASTDAPAPPPLQINEIQQGPSSNGAVASSSSAPELASDKDVSSSKKKKKKGLKKIISPF